MDEDLDAPDPSAVVRRFGAAWDRLDFDAIAALLAPDILYHNVPTDPIRGAAAVDRYLRAAGPFDACRWEFLSIAVAGDTVLTERIDHLTVRGRRIVLPVMGRFDIAAGLIAVWRDYFDLANYRAQWPDAEEGGR